jgi:Ca2+-binding RTX toxin-like protein
LIGGAGSDLFLFAAGGGHDVVQDFVRGGVDHLQISGYSGYQELRQVGLDTLVVLSATDDVLLKNVTALSLTSADLFFL